MSRFGQFLAIDWSGAAGERHKGIALAVAHADGGADPDDGDDAETITSPSGSATDPGVTRHRPLVLVAETQSGGPSLASRAAHEAKTRAARGRQAVYTLPGWRNAQGGLWRKSLR